MNKNEKAIVFFCFVAIAAAITAQDCEKSQRTADECYLRNYPNGKHVAEVKKLSIKLEKIKEEKEMYNGIENLADCYAYLEMYPEGRYVRQVQAKVNKILAEMYMYNSEPRFEWGSFSTRGKWETALRNCNEYVKYNDYEGSYKGQISSYGEFSGLGMYAYDNCSYYIGEWENGYKNGEGIYTLSPGYYLANCPGCVYYEGGWKDDVKNGTGSCYDMNGKLIYCGTLGDNKPMRNYPQNRNSDDNDYEFKFIEYPSGDCYIGETWEGKFHGKGIYIWSNGDSWYGDWTDGVRDGEGISMPYKGVVRCETWEEGKKIDFKK